MRTRLITTILAAFFILFFVSASAHAAKWTILVYLNGDNNLEPYGISDFLEMAQVGSNSNINIIVQFDRASGYASTYGNWTDCKRFRVTSGMTPDAGNALSSLGEVDMGNPQTLVDFVEWGIDNYPADKYFVDVWNHGGGWTESALMEVVRDCSNDDSSGNSIGVANGELRSAASQIYSHLGRKVDLWGFDCCLMHMLEVNYELKNYANYMVASEELEGGNGWEYASWLQNLNNNSTASAATLGQYVAQAYYNTGEDTQSVSDLSRVSATVVALDDFAIALQAAKASGYESTLTSILNAAQDFGQGYGNPVDDYVDLYDYAERCYNASLPSNVHTTAQALMNALDLQITCNYAKSSGYSGANGVSIYLPPTSEYYSSYGNLLMSDNCSWDEFISNAAPAYTPTGTVYTENPNISIPDNNATGISDTMYVGMSKTISEVNLYVDITHTYIGDLEVRLSSPSTTTVLIHNRSGSSADDIKGWYDPELQPYESLSAFIGTNCYGTWTISVSDHAGADVGTLKSWKLEIK